MAKSTSILNIPLLFNSDLSTKAKLAQQILHYCSYNLSLTGSRYTRHDFIMLTEEVLKLDSNKQRLKSPGIDHGDLIFPANTGIIKHLKGIQKAYAAKPEDENFSLLRLIYLPNGVIPTAA